MSRTTVHSWSIGATLPRCTHPTGAMFQLVLNVAELETYALSTSIRLCSVLLAHTVYTAEASFQTYLDHVRSKAVSHGPGDNTTLFYFRFSIELVCECSHFDSLDRLKQFTAPLLQHIHTTTTAAVLWASIDGPLHHLDSPSVRPLLQCFAHLLTRRGAMLLTGRTSASRGDRFYRGFTSLLLHLSLSFDSISHWMDPTEPPVERARKIEALQAAGILGMSANDEDHTNTTKSTHYQAAVTGNIRTSAENMSTWMDVAFFSNGYQPSCGKDKAPIFSLYSTTNAIPPSTSTYSSEKVTSSSECCKSRRFG